MSHDTLNPADYAFLARQCFPVSLESFTATLASTGFSADAYRDSQPDLVMNCPRSGDAMAHFLRYGVFERRIYPIALDIDAVRRLLALPVDDRTLLTMIAASLCHAHTSLVADADAGRLEQALSQLAPLGEFGAKPYLILGDSHSFAFRRSITRNGEWLVPYHVLCSAGSAMGLGNPASRSGYGNRLRAIAAMLEKAPEFEHLPILLQFGQVDVEFVHPFRRIDRGLTRFDPDECMEFCRRSVESYVGFVSDAFAKSLQQVDLLAIFPPALADAQWAAGYANAHIASLESSLDAESLIPAIRALEIPDIRVRTGIHREYNRLLLESCGRSGIRLIDSFTPFLGVDGLLDPAFVPNSKGADHHLEYSATDEICTRLLWHRIGRADPRNG